MANSIIGAFYIGLFTASFSPATPVDGVATQVLPQPQCVLCGPASRGRVSRVYDWTTGRTKAVRWVLPGNIPAFSIGDLMLDQRLDMTSQQADRMARYAGV